MKTIAGIAGSLLVAVIFFGCTPQQSYKEDRLLELSAEGLGVLEITGGNGDIGIKGSDTADTISVTGSIEVSGEDPEKIREAINKQLLFTLEKRGNRAVLESRFAESFFILSLFLDRGRKVDVNVEIPSSLELFITDNGGNLYISDMKNDITVRDEDGSCVIEKVNGATVEIIDNTGPIMLTNITGRIEIEDKSGDIEISSCKGSFEILDTTGELILEMCEGDVSINDSTGNISIEDHTGDITLHARGRGDVTLQDVSGRIIQNY